MLGSYCPNLKFKLSADIIKTLTFLLKHFIHIFDQEFYGTQYNLLNCGAFLPDELYAELLYIFYTDNFIFKNSKYF